MVELGLTDVFSLCTRGSCSCFEVCMGLSIAVEWLRVVTTLAPRASKEDHETATISVLAVVTAALGVISNTRTS